MTDLKKKFSIVDYGTSNLASITKAFLKVNANIEIINTPEQIEKSDRLILPGVGSFGSGIKKLNELDLINPIVNFAKKGNPILGICLGMQLLLERSEENSEVRGLNLIDGRVEKIPNYDKKEYVRKIPHIGWNNLIIDHKKILNKKLFSQITDKDYFYFVHSYMCEAKNLENILARCDYKKQLITGIIQKENILGFQFHPEISGKSGLKIINNFIDIY